MKDLLTKTEALLRRKTPLLLAIDGGAASGKTTLAAELAARFDGAVIHMDDFFLQPAQRTPARLAEPGGNLDRERFLAEVIPHLKERKSFTYRRFDCTAMALGALVTVPAKKLYLIEGSYSHHPAFRANWDLAVFLDTDLETRLSRILRRNGKEKYEQFLTRWIPMEDRYFESFSIKEKADLVLHGTP